MRITNTAAEMLAFLHNKDAVALSVKELTTAAVARKVGGLSLDWEGSCVPRSINIYPMNCIIRKTIHIMLMCIPYCIPSVYIHADHFMYLYLPIYTIQQQNSPVQTFEESHF